VGTALLVCIATEREAMGLRGRLGGEHSLLVTGVGPVAAAHSATLFLARHRVGGVISCGVGGAYPGSGLKVGAVVCAATEQFADLGAESPEGFLDLGALGFPLVDSDPPLHSRLPLSLFPAARRVDCATCSTCTGTEATAREREGRTGAAMESMEGAAIVQVALTMGVRVGEVRGISNPAGVRDRAAWKIDEAVHAAQETLLGWIEAGAC